MVLAVNLGVQLAAPLALSALPVDPPQAVIGIAPSKNSTFPVGVPDPGAEAVTVAVRLVC
jgi:hypothetical protein